LAHVFTTAALQRFAWMIKNDRNVHYTTNFHTLQLCSFIAQRNPYSTIISYFIPLPLLYIVPFPITRTFYPASYLVFRTSYLHTSLIANSQLNKKTPYSISNTPLVVSRNTERDTIFISSITDHLHGRCSAYSINN
jgi:hypothetical protein